MITKLAKRFCLSNTVYRFAMAVLSSRLIHSREPLTRFSVYHSDRDWVIESVELGPSTFLHYWVERGIKDEEKIWIRFDGDDIYRVWYGPDRTFIGEFSNKTALELFFLAVRRDERYKLGRIES